MKDLRAVLQDADRGKVAVGHFNISDLTILHAVFSAARELQLPVLMGLSESERDFVGVRQAVALIRSLRDEYDYPIFVNADHTHSLARAEEAARAGFDEIMFDASALPFEQNINQTRRVVENMKSINPAIVVEGEIGYIGTSSEIHDRAPAGMSAHTTPEEAKQFIQETRVDVLAPAVGNMHGMLKSMAYGEEQKHLDLNAIADIKRATGSLLTLHGGSGTNDEDLRNAIEAGITIIHINTEIRLAWRQGLEAALAAEPDEVAPYKLLPRSFEKIKHVATARLQLFSHKETPVLR